ncbi:MAG: hypothetical protein RJA38_1346, partial [Bacteroidota bacterium]
IQVPPVLADHAEAYDTASSEDLVNLPLWCSANTIVFMFNSVLDDFRLVV